MTTRELDHFTGRASHAAAHVQHLHVTLDPYLICQVVFVSSYGLGKWLSERESAEVERFAPSVLV